MLLPINWHTYAIACLVLMAIYYVIVILLFYRNKISTVTKRAAFKKAEKSNDSLPSLFPEQNGKVFTIQNQSPAPDLSPLVHDLVDELEAFLLQAEADEAEKEIVLGYINKLLQRYPALKGSPYQSAINNLISVSSETHCNIRFNAEEQLTFWK
jgi:hypothetical protein